MLKLINIQFMECSERGALLKNIWDCHIQVFNRFIKESTYEKNFQSRKIEELKFSTESLMEELNKKIIHLEASLIKKEKEFNNYKLQSSIVEQQENKLKKKNELLTEAFLGLRKIYEETLLENIKLKLKCKYYDFEIGEQEFLKFQEQKILENQQKKDQSIFDFLKAIKMLSKYDKKGFSKTNNLNSLLHQIVKTDDDQNIYNNENLENYEEINKDVSIDTADLYIQKEKEIWTENFFLKYFTKEKEIQTLNYDELVSENKNHPEETEKEIFRIFEEPKFIESIIFESVFDKNIRTNIIQKPSCISSEKDDFKKVDVSETKSMFEFFDEMKEFLNKIKNIFDKICSQKMIEKEGLNIMEPELLTDLIKEIDKNLINYETIYKVFKQMNNIHNQSQLSLKIENLEHKLDFEESEKQKRKYQMLYEEIEAKFSSFFKETIKIDEEFLVNEDSTQNEILQNMNSVAPIAVLNNSGFSNLKTRGSILGNSMLLSVKNPQNKFSRKSMVKLSSIEANSKEKIIFPFKSSNKLGDKVINEFSETNAYPEALTNINNGMLENQNSPENTVTIPCNNKISMANFLNSPPRPNKTAHRKTLSFDPKSSVKVSFSLEKGHQIKDLLSNTDVFDKKEILEKKEQFKKEKNESNEETANLINQISDFLTKKRRWSKIQGPNSDKCANFLIKLQNSNLKSNQSLSLNIILKLISQIYSEILKSYQMKQSNLNPFFFIFYEFIFQKFGGSREKAENKMIRIIQSCQSLAENNKVRMFMKLLSLTKIKTQSLNNEDKFSIKIRSAENFEINDPEKIYDFYDGNDLKLYFDLLAQLDDNPITNTPGMILAMSSSEQIITSLYKAIEIVRNFSGNFFIKKGQKHIIENVINLLKRMKQKDPMIFRKYVIDVDYVIERIFEIRDLMNETYQIAFKAADLYKKSGLNSREFLFLLKNIERKSLRSHQIMNIFYNEYDFEIEGSNEKCISFKRFAYLCQSKNILTSKTQEEFLEDNFFGLKNIFQLKEELEFRRDLIKIKLIKTKSYDSYYRNMIKNVENNVFLHNLNENDVAVIWMRYKLLDNESHNLLLDEAQQEILCEYLKTFNDFFSEKNEELKMV